MQQVFRQLRLADPATTVIFQGEPGTGKQHIARTLHYRGSTGRRAFVPLVCRDLAPFDVRALLKQAREAAEVDAPTAPGTLYFQNLEDLSRELQDSLLEWLTSPPPRLRFFFGSRLPLSALRELDRFVEGFWLAISDLVIEVPPLRLRGDDLALLAQYFLEERNRGRDAAETLDGIDPLTLERLKEHDWPGHVRQLQAVIRDSAERATGPLLAPGDLSFGFQAATSARAAASPHRDALVPLDELLAKVEREQLEAALQAARGNKSRAADLLGVTRPRLYRRLTELGILADDVSDGPPNRDSSDSPTDQTDAPG
jgi:DNA-binding NtrC family response regulator